MYAPRSLHILTFPTLRAHLARRCPFYYGWVVFAIAASTSYAARPLMSVAVLSVFMVPMTDYYGRQHLGTIRGITLPVQFGGQAVGPITAGFAFDATGSYQMVFLFFAGVVALGSLLVLTAIPPSSAGSPMIVEADEIP
jgi:MFS family permease